MTTGGLTIRPAFPDDAGALARLAALDSARVPAGALLLAEVDGMPWAAIALDSGRVIADPFRPTAALVELLARRAAQLAGADGGLTARHKIARWPTARPSSWARTRSQPIG
jgi:hypothetical protein